MYAFENGVLMLRNIGTPFLNALDVRRQSGHFRREFASEKKDSPGETQFLSFKMVPS